MSNKVENAITRLCRNSKKNNTENLVQIENNILKINHESTELWGTLIFIIFLIILPIGILIHQIIFNFDYLTIGLLILTISILIFQLLKIVKGGTKLEINTNEKYVKVENNHLLFKKIITVKQFNFDEISKTELVEKSIKHKYRTSKWLRLNLSDRKGNKHILTDFNSNYPNSSLAHDVKYLIDAIISQSK